jgi:hypothetical protein
MTFATRASPTGWASGDGSLLMLCDRPSDDQREQAEEAVTSCPTETLFLHEN